MVFSVLLAFSAVFIACLDVDILSLTVTVAGMAVLVVLVGDHIVFINTVSVGDVLRLVCLVGAGVLYVL